MITGKTERKSQSPATQSHDEEQSPGTRLSVPGQASDVQHVAESPVRTVVYPGCVEVQGCREGYTVPRGAGRAIQHPGVLTPEESLDNSLINTGGEPG